MAATITQILNVVLVVAVVLWRLTALGLLGSGSGSRLTSKPLSAGENAMNAMRIAAIALIIAGALGLAYGSFSYTKETQQAKIGPLELTVSDRETVNVPVWAGVAAIMAGALLLLVPKNS
jgi:preprotein translocase subunit SecG